MQRGFARTTRAPQHIIDTGTWGVSDPADGPGAAFATRRRGRSRPIFAATPVLGRSPGGKIAARPGGAVRQQHRLVQGIAAARATECLQASEASLEQAPLRGGGQPRLGLASPSSAPLLERIDDRGDPRNRRSPAGPRSRRSRRQLRHTPRRMRASQSDAPRARWSSFARTRLASVGRTSGSRSWNSARRFQASRRSESLLAQLS